MLFRIIMKIYSFEPSTVILMYALWAYVKYDNTKSINYFEIITLENLYGHRIILHALYLVLV